MVVVIVDRVRLGAGAGLVGERSAGRSNADAAQPERASDREKGVVDGGSGGLGAVEEVRGGRVGHSCSSCGRMMTEAAAGEGWRRLDPAALIARQRRRRARCGADGRG